MPQSIWSPDMLTGVAVMDELHRDFFDALDRMPPVPEATFCRDYGALVTILERTFAAEEEWMEQRTFPIIKSHREQHARVLSALHHVHSMVLKGDVRVGKDVVLRLLPDWFVLHVSTMDMALAMFMQLCQSSDTQAIPATGPYSMAYTD